MRIALKVVQLIYAVLLLAALSTIAAKQLGQISEIVSPKKSNPIDKVNRNIAGCVKHPLLSFCLACFRTNPIEKGKIVMTNEDRKLKYKKLTAELTAAQFDVVAAFAKRNGLSKSDVVRNALTAYLRAL